MPTKAVSGYAGASVAQLMERLNISACRLVSDNEPAIEALGFARARTVEDLWGYCRSCPFAATCLGGCTFTAHALLGRPGNNPYCHFRAREHAKRGLRERLVPATAAPGLPFDHGTFEIVVEPLDAEDPGANRSPSQLVQITRRAGTDQSGR